MRIVFDLDGTLADDSHRKHFLMIEPKNWFAYFDACDKDLPIWAVMDTMCALNSMRNSRDGYVHSVEIWSGRSEGEDLQIRAKTIEWFRTWTRGDVVIPKTHALDFFTGDPDINLRMRAHDDHRPDYELKRGWLDRARASGQGPDLVFEDRQRCVYMWRSAGVPCFQVAEGSF